jgi:hypothetical protein
MAGYLYYIPKVLGSLVETTQLPEPLREVFAGASLESGSPIDGPDGSQGTVVAIQGTRPHLTIYRDQPDKQHWAPVSMAIKQSHAAEPSVAMKASYWIGYDVASPPTPDELRRPKSPGGRAVELADGHSWLIPSVAIRNVSLPRQYRYSGGEFALAVDPRYDQVVREAQDWFPFICDRQRSGEQYTYANAFAFFTRVLAINYHVDLVECSFAQPVWSTAEVDGESVWGAIFGLTDVLADIEQKKTGSDTPPPGIGG